MNPVLWLSFLLSLAMALGAPASLRTPILMGQVPAAAGIAEEEEKHVSHKLGVRRSSEQHARPPPRRNQRALQAAVRPHRALHARVPRVRPAPRRTFLPLRLASPDDEQSLRN